MIMAADEQVIATVSTLVLLLMVYLPVIVVNAWKYAQNCHHIVYQKRHARITLYVVILVVIHILFKCTTLVIQYLVPRSVGNPLGRLELVSRCIHSVIDFAILYCWIWRFWLLSFECKLLVFLSKHRWQTILNAQYKSQRDVLTQNAWYLSHKKNFGNSAFCGKYIIFPMVILSSSVRIAFYGYFSPNTLGGFAFNFTSN